MKNLVTLLTLLLLANSSFSQTTSSVTGPWNTGATWVGGLVPAPGADVIIAAGDAVTIDVNIDVNSLTIEAGGSLIVANGTGPFSLNISGDLVNLGTLTFLNGTGEVNVIYDNGATAVIAGSGATNFNDLTISGGGNLINNLPFDVLGDFIIDGVEFTSNGTGVTFLGDFTLVSSASYETTGSTTNFDGSVAQALDFSGGTVSFNNIDFDGGGTKTINGNLFTNGGTVEVFAGTVIADLSPGNTHTIYNLEVNDQNALDLSGSTVNFMGGEIRFGANVNTDGTIDFGVGAGVGTDGTDDVDIVVVSGNLTIERDDQLVIDGDITVEDPAQLIIQGVDPFSVTGTELDATITDHNGSHTLTLNATADIYPQGGDNFPRSFGTYAFGPNSFVRYNQPYNQVIRGEDDGGNLIPYANLLLNQGGVKILNPGEDLRISADFNINGGSEFRVTHEAEITVLDDITNNGITNAFNAQASTLYLSGTLNQTLTPLGAAYFVRKLIITNPGNVSRTVNLDDEIILNPSGTSATGQSLFQVSNPGGGPSNLLVVDLDDNTILGSNQSFNKDELSIGANCAIYTSGTEFARDFNTASSLDVSNLDANSTVRFDSPDIQTIPNISGSYGNIEFNGDGDKYISSSSASLTILGDVTRIGGGFVFYLDQFYLSPPGIGFNFPSYSINVGGDWSLRQASTAVNGAGGTVTFTGVDQQILASNFENVVFDGSGTKTIQGALNVSGDLSIPTSGVTVETDDNIDISGNWSEAAGTVFNQTAGTTNFVGAGTQTVSVQSTSYFNNLDIEAGATLELASPSMTMQGSFNLRNGGIFDLDGADNSAREIRIGLNAFFDDASTLSFTNTAAKIILDGDIGQNFDNEIGGPYPTLQFEGVGEKDLIDQNFDVDGDMIITSGSTVNGNNEAIDFSGASWTADGNFIHNNTVTFSRTGTATTVSASNFNNIVIGDGLVNTTVTLSGNISLENNLTINDESLLDASIGNYNIQLEQDWNNYGSFSPGTGTVIFVGNASQIRTDDDVADIGDDEVQLTEKAFYNLRINNADGQDVILEDDEIQDGVLTVLNNFVVETGNFRFNEDNTGTIGTQTLRVGGDFNLAGGVLEYQNADINTIELFANGTGGETHEIDLGGSIVREFQITNNEGDTYQLTNTFEINDDVDDEFVFSGASTTFDLNGQIMIINQGGLEMADGILQIDEGASLVIDDQAVDPDFNKTGGNLELIGTAISPATLTSLDASGFSFQQSAGDFEAFNYAIARTNGNGINITGGTVTDFSEGLFTNGLGNAYLTLGSGIAIGNISAPGVAFNDGPTYNVDASGVPASGYIEFVIAGGTLSGSVNENDDGSDGAGFVRWLNDPGFTWTGAGGDGDWTNSANWSEDGDVSVDINGNDIPDEATDVVFINSAGTPPLLNGGQNINIGRLTLNSGSITIDGGELNVDGNVTIFSGASFTLTQATDFLRVEGSFANAGTFSQNLGKVSFDAASGSHSVNSVNDFVNLSIDGGTDVVYSLGSDITVTEAFSLNGGTFDGSSGFAFNILGDWTVSGGTFSPGVGTVNFSGNTGSGNQNISGGTLNNATFSGQETKTFVGNVSVAGDFTINNNSGDLIAENGTAIILFVGDDWNNNNTNAGATSFTANDGTVVFNGEGGQNIGGNQPTTFGNITFQGSNTKNINTDILVNLDMTITTPTVRVTNGNTITGGDVLTMSGGILQINDTNNFPSFTTTTLLGGTVSYWYRGVGNAAGDQTISNDISYNNLELRSQNGADVVNRTLGGDIAINGVLTLGQGDITLVAGSNVLFITGDNAPNANHIVVGADDDITWAAGGVLFHRGDNQWNIDADLSGIAFENIFFEGGVKNLLADISVDGLFDIGNDVTFDQNTFSVTNPDNIGAFILGNNAVYLNNSANSLPIGFNSVTLAPSSQTTLNATIAQTLNTATYGALTINSDLTVTLDGPLTVEGDFLMNNQATLVDGGFDLTFNGSSIDLRDFTPTATVTFSGGDQNITDNDGDVGNLEFLDVVFSGSGTKTITVNQADIIEVLALGTLSIDPGVVFTTGESVRFRGQTITNSGSLITTTAGNPFIFDGSAVAFNPGSNNIAALSLENAADVSLNTNGLVIGNGDITIGDGSSLDFGNDLTHFISSDDIFLNTTGELLFGAVGNESTLVFERLGTQRIPFIDATNNPTQITNIPNVVLSGSGTKLMTGSLLVNDITLEASITQLDIDVDNEYSIEVRGSWNNQGTAFIEREGIVTFFATNTDTETITTNDDQFAEVIFDGSADRTYTLVGDLTIEGEGGSRPGTAGTFETALTLTRGTLDLNGNELTLGNNDGGDTTPEISIIGSGGRLIVDEGAILSFNTDDDEGDFGNNLDAAAVLQVDGRLDVDGVPGNAASVTRSGGNDRITITIESGATIEADNYSFNFLADEGLQVLDGALFAREDATVAANTTFSNGSFNNMNTNAGPNTYLLLEADLGSAVYIDNINFNFDGTPTVSNHFNVERSNAVGNNQINFTNTSGGLGANGGLYETDPAGQGALVGLLQWEEPSFTAWVGTVSSEWRTAGNWDNGLPSTVLDAVINLGTPFNPTLDLNAGDLTISGLSINDGILRVIDSDGASANSITIDGDVLISGGGTFITNADAGIEVTGSFEIADNATYDNGNAVITLSGATTTTPIFSTGTESVGSLLISGDADYQFTGNTITVEGDLTVTGAASINPLNAYNFYIGGDVSFLAGTILNTSTDGDIILNGTTGGTQSVVNLKADGLILAGTDDVDLNTVTVDDVFTINNGVIATGSGSITWGNDVIIDGTFNGADGIEYTFAGDDWIAGQGSYGNQFGTVVFTNTGANTYIRQSSNAVADSVEFHSVILRGSSVISLGRFINGAQADGNIRMSGDLTIENSIGELRVNDYLISNNVTGTGTLVLQAGERIEVDGVDNFPKDFAVYAMDPTSTVAYEANFDQTIRGAFTYGNLILNNGSVSSLGADINIAGNLDINAGNTLDVTNNNYSLRLSGRWDTEDGATDGSFIARSGTVILEGGNDQIVQIGNSGTQSFYTIQIDKSAGTVDFQNDDFTIIDDLTIEDGTLDINSLEVAIGGNLDVTGSGAITSNAAGTLLLNATNGSPTLRTNGSNFLGSVIINAPSRVYTMLDDMIIDNVLTITAGTLEVNGNRLDVGNNEDIINIFGTLNVSTAANPGGTLALGNQAQLLVQAGGTINVVGTASQAATVTRRATGSYGFNVSGASGNPGIIGARYYVFEYMDSNGIRVDVNGVINTTNNFSEGTFANGLAGGTFLKIENSQSLLEADGEQITNVVFNDNPGGGAVNVSKTVGTTGVVEFENYTGEFSGENFDSDPNNLIIWLDPAEIVWTGIVSRDWFNPNNWSTLSVPSITNDVVIPASPTQATLNPPLIFDGNFGGDDAVAAEVANLSIEPGNSLTINTADADVDTDLRVAGTVTLASSAGFRSIGSNDAIEIGGSLILNGSPTFTPGSGSTFTFNASSGLVTVNTIASFHNLIVDAAGTFSLLKALNVSNDFTLTASSGQLRFNGFNMTVGGNFQNLNPSATSIVTGTRTLTLSPFAASTYTFNPGASELYNVIIGNGTTAATYQLGSSLDLSNNFTVRANTILDLNAYDVSVGDAIADVETAQINGDVIVNGGESFRLGNLTSLVVSSTGNFQLAGTSNVSRATLTRKGTTGNYTVTVNSGGEFGADFYNISYSGGAGISIASGGILTAVLAGDDVDVDTNPGADDLVLRNGTFSNGAGTAYLTLANSFGGLRKADNVVFNAGPTFNVSRNGTLDDIVFVDPSGTMQGPNFENDSENTPTLEASTGNVQWFYNNPLYTWTGANGTDVFADDSNWTAVALNGAGPININTVIIDDAGINPYPIVTVDATIASLSINAGTSITVADGITLTILGDLTNAGTLNLVGTGSVEVQGTLNNTGSINAGVGSTVTVVLDEDINFEGGSSFYNLTFDTNGSPYTATATGSLEVNGDLLITNNATLQMNDPSHTLSVGGNFTVDELTNGALDISDGTVSLNGSTTQAVVNTAGSEVTFNNLSLFGGSIKSLDENVTVNGDLLIEGNATRLSPGVNTLSLDGDLTINNGALLVAGTGDVQFTGNAVQRISGTGSTTSVTFHDLTINNGSVGNNDIQLALDVFVGNSVDFINGIVSSSASNPMIFNDGAIVQYDGVGEVFPTGSNPDTNGDGLSYVSGPVIKIGDDEFIFPLGEGARHARMGISALAGTPLATDRYSAQYFFATPADVNATKELGIVRVSYLEYWDLSNVNGHGAQPFVTLFWDNVSDVTDPTTLTIAHYNSVTTTWDNQGNASTVGDANGGSITASNILTSFSPITLATTDDATNPLPVELVYFDGVAEDNSVQLLWATASEVNNDFFQIERSVDGIDFQSIGTMSGNGNTNELVEYRFVDSKPNYGANYYRLRQVDFDGTAELHSVIQVANDFIQKDVSIASYPNPADQSNLNIQIISGDNHTPFEVKIVNVSGQVFYSRSFEGSLVLNEKIAPRREMNAGIYFLVVTQGEKVKKSKVVIR